MLDDTPTIKWSDDMNTTEFKNVAEAAAELTRKTTNNMTDISIKAWKDVIAFGDVVAKAQADAVKGYAPGYDYSDVVGTFSKMQNDAIKAFAGWANGFNHGK